MDDKEPESEEGDDEPVKYVVWLKLSFPLKLQTISRSLIGLGICYGRRAVEYFTARADNLEFPYPILMV